MLFTSREKPIQLVLLEGSRSPVRMLRLAGLETKPCEQLLAEKGIAGTDARTGALLQALRRSPDGTKLASCGDDDAIRIWDLESGDPLQLLRRDRPYERLNITGIMGLTAAQKASLRALGAVEDDAAQSLL